tara:strand:+ start:362 stop:772 length:411 start_codon:yes stop_codon:yes gene_type:complete
MKKEKTIHELVKEFPDKSYRELEKYREADRQEEAEHIPLSESQKSQDDLEPITNTKGVCVTGALKKGIDPILSRVKELEIALANALEVNESHQKLNGKIQERLTELEQENIELHTDNKKLANQIEDKVDQLRKSGM